MKILVLGDIHGRLIWKDIIERENPDLTIFLGDYVSTHELISAEQQLSNLEDILNYTESNLDKVILLRGNHDLEACNYYWASCSGHDPYVTKGMLEMKDRFLILSQWLYVYNNIVFSHAGVSKRFIENVENHLHLYDLPLLDILNIINSIEPCELFAFTPCKMSDYYGISETQPLTWIRPQTLVDCAIDGYIQVVGHTPVKHIINIKEVYLESKADIWLCDNLPKEYLVIEDNQFIPKSLDII